MRLTKIIKEFRFEEEVRDLITLGTKTRLNPDLHYLQLEEQSDGSYPTDSDLNVKTWVAQPHCVKAWLGFQVDVTLPTVKNVAVTSVGFRLSNGTNQYWWNGASWEINTSSWNTEIEVATNIGSFTIADQKLQVVINLKTTNPTVTPLVRSVKVLYDGDIHFQEDLIYRSLVPSLDQQVRPKGRTRIKLAANSSTVDISVIETPYNIESIDGAFNHTDDPEHLTDLYQSYDSGTKVVTLSSEQSAGKVIHIDFLWKPEVIVATSQDYTELEKVPSIVLNDINFVDASETGVGDNCVFNKGTFSGWKVGTPIQGDLEFTMRLITDKSVDLMRLSDEVKRWIMNNRFLTSFGLDEEYRLWLINEFDMTTAANKEDIHSGRLVFRLVGALFLEQDAEQVYAVKQFKLQGDMDVTVS